MINLLRCILKVLEKIIFNVLKIFPVNDTRILFESEGDFSDNSYALYDYMKKNGYFNKYDPIWLVSHPERKNENVKTIKKWGTRIISIKRLYYLATSKYLIYDHNNILAEYGKRPNQYVVNLWHGVAIKGKKGDSDEFTNKEDLMCVLGDFWKPVMSYICNCDESKIVSLGHPRNDYFFSDISENVKEFIKREGWNSFEKVIFWMPTFRKSITDELSEKYYDGNTGLPIIKDEKDIFSFNEWLKNNNILITAKLININPIIHINKKTQSIHTKR